MKNDLFNDRISRFSIRKHNEQEFARSYSGTLVMEQLQVFGADEVKRKKNKLMELQLQQKLTKQRLL